MSSCDSSAWRRLRSRLLARLFADAGAGLIDPDILGIVLSLNSLSCIVTSSSCSGRIGVFGAPEPGDKRHGGLLARWHRRVSEAEVAEALREARGYRFVWVSAQPVILSLYVCGQGVLRELVGAMESVGFKYTCAKPASAGHGIYYVLVMGTERIDVPVVYDGSIVVGDVGVIVRVVNSYLSLAKSKLDRLKRAIAAIRARLEPVCGVDDKVMKLPYAEAPAHAEC